MTPRVETFLAQRTAGEPERLREDIREMVAQRDELLAALKDMEAEKSDYMMRNNLGDPAKEHSNGLARKAIARAEGAQNV